jgi:hypothetical protein
MYRYEVLFRAIKKRNTPVRDITRWSESENGCEQVFAEIQQYDMDIGLHVKGKAIP